MCWITLSPSKDKHKHHDHDHHHHHHDSRHGSCDEKLVRIRRSTMVDIEDGETERIRVLSPATVRVPSVEVKERVRWRERDGERRHLRPHLHHHHPHMHPHIPLPHHLHLPHGHHLHVPHPHHLHLPHGYHHHHHHHLHGHGKKRAPAPYPPPPSRCHSREPPEPIYRTQVVEPSSREIRETTRVALREVRPERERGRLRRVAGYEVLGRDVPWSWDAVSSIASGGRSRRDGSVVGRGGLRFPPFGGAGSWM
ncbi:hypothetical protein K504DRAFT_184100 [Pleomassaria siparia CBS 279.74]|uniref:Uncharacterized protein n=1 Tax=Pleomassaria siparia CBS 279.74 TaxID=1314801 RepID=A0A6G1JSB6_9PLEO|nr:hypothetical protein K504DRAFT_184100 [Pleomassaria siparia CBS 279.74]